MDSYRDLKIWQVGMDIAAQAYKITCDFPKSELFAMTSQIRRCSSSIPANIAEGFGRNSQKEYARFINIANGSLKELETHILLSVRVEIITYNYVEWLLQMCDDEGKMIRSLLNKIQSTIE